MTKIILGQRPAAFAEREVRFPAPEGGDDYVISYKGKYRTATEFGAMVDESVKKQTSSTADAGEFSMEKFFGSSVDNKAHLLTQVVDSWDAGFELNEQTAAQFANELPAGAQAILDDYRAQCIEGKTGNSKK